MNLKKLFSEVLMEESYYSVGQSIKFDLQGVREDNPETELGFGYGMIVDKRGMDYICRLDTGKEVLVKNQYAYAFGNADGDANS